MRPEILLLGSGWVAEVDEALERAFTCHRMAQVAPAGRDAFVKRIGPRVRGVYTTGVAGIDGALAARLPQLEIVTVHGVGVDAVDVDALAPRRIAVTNTPDVLTEDVADLAVALLLAASRRLPQLDRYVRAGEWEAKTPLRPSRSLRAKVAGIVGLGRIGRAVATRLSSFGMEIRYFQRSTADSPYTRSESLLALAAESDYLVVCAPGGAATRAMIDGAVLEALGRDGTLVNIARGSVVDTAALAAALREGRLGAAGLDVYESEPRPPAELIELPNVVLTPHVAGWSPEAVQRSVDQFLANVQGHLSGQGPVAPV